MAVDSRALGGARYFYMVTFEIAPEDEREFNEIYDNEHIPDLLTVDGVKGVLRLRDGEPNQNGWLVYSALYLIATPELPDTPQWKARSEIGRWAPVMRPRLKSRVRRTGTIVAAELAAPDAGTGRDDEATRAARS
jgi:hypothetical protein